MKKKSVFVVDENLNYINEISRELSKEEFNVVGYSQNGKDALEKLRKISELDVLIINMILPLKDGYSVLEEIKENGKYYPNIGFIIAQSSLINEHSVYLLNRLEISQLVLLPTNIENIISHIKKYVNYKNEVNPINDGEKINQRITKILHYLGIPAHIKGYHFIREAVEMVIKNPSIIGQVTKTLYPTIAQKFASSPTKVERAIRHAIELGWTRGDQQKMDEIFGYTISALKAKPTNSEFIAMIADYISLNEDTAINKNSQYMYKMSY